MRPENGETMASGAAPPADAAGPRQPRKHLQGPQELMPLLITDRMSPALPSLDTSGRSVEEGEKVVKRKRRLVLRAHQGEGGDRESMVSVTAEGRSATSGVSGVNADRKRSADEPGGGLSSPLDAGDTLVIRKKWRREACASAEEHDRMNAEQLGVSAPLRRSMSSLGILATAPKRPSLERRQLSAAAIDAVAASAHELALPTVPSRDHPDLNVISAETVQRVLAGEFSGRLASAELIDCRFPYEHQGGSLRGSRLLSDPASVEAAFMARPSPDSTRVALIFFCEFSANRAPKMARHLRNLDRWIHADRYPELFYPELYLIDGGYRNCFETLKDKICHPPAYVRMDDENFADACRLEFSAWRRRWKAHKIADCAKQFRRTGSLPAATDAAAAAAATAAKFRARPVLSLADQL